MMEKSNLLAEVVTWHIASLFCFLIDNSTYFIFLRGNALCCCYLRVT